jgi:hypothetical protein
MLKGESFTGFPEVAEIMGQINKNRGEIKMLKEKVITITGLREEVETMKEDNRKKDEIIEQVEERAEQAEEKAKRIEREKNEEIEKAKKIERERMKRLKG